MSISDFFILAEDCPDNVPSREDIVALSKEAGYYLRGMPFHDPSSKSQPISAWLKSGPYVTMAEAFTQNMVSNTLNANPDSPLRVPRVYQAFLKDLPQCGIAIGYIVMEYIDGPDCDENDYKIVAEAVQWLISIKGPTSAPGPVGGGPIAHRFFIEWISPTTYTTVKQLEQHINGILKYGEDPRRVNLVKDTKDGLRLCPSAINPGNFKKLSDGKMVALDFGATCFVPPCFFAVAVALYNDNFTRRVAHFVNYPEPDDVLAIVNASLFIVPFGTNNIGLPKGLPKTRPV